MKCPNCGARLNKYVYHGTAVDVCADCGGVWFEGEELKLFISKFLERNSDIPEAKIDLNKQIKIQKEIEYSESLRLCPKCGDRMPVFNFAYDSNIILNRCDICEGIWADGKEIHALAIHRKGNENMRELGRAIVETTNESEQLRRLAELGGSLSQNARVWYFLPKIILPLKDTAKRSIFPIATISLIVLNVLIFVYQSVYIIDPESFFNTLGTVPTKFINNGAYFTIFTSMFLHADFWHLVGNMFFLWMFGGNIEESFGRARFLIFYFLAGIFSDLIFIAANQLLDIPAFGASGAIAGVMGAYFILYPRAEIKTLVINQIIDIPVYFYLGGWIIAQILWSLAEVPGIAWSAHISGFIFGAFIGWLYRKIILSPYPKALS